MEWYRITANLLGSYAWPLIALALGLAFLVRYRSAIDALLSRVSEIRTPVGSVSTQQMPVSAEGPEVGLKKEALEETRTQLEKTHRDLSEWQTVAIRYAAGYQYEVTYRLIYGSQIALLRHLNVSPGGRAEDELEQYYQMFLMRGRAAGSVMYGYPKDAYLTFLVGRGLIVQVEGRFFITEQGRGFLQYVDATGLPDKPY